MTFGHPTDAWPECCPRLNGTFPMGFTAGLLTIKNRFFQPYLDNFDLKEKVFVKKFVKKGQTGLPEAHDGDGGGLGRVEEGQNGLVG